MKKILTVLLAVCAAAGLYAQSKPIVRSSGSLMTVAYPNGAIMHYADKTNMGILMLQIHWSHSIDKSKDIKLIPEKNGFSYTGTVDNISFSSRTIVKSGRADTEYSVVFQPYNRVLKGWEVTPFLNMNVLKILGNCRYTAEYENGTNLTGDISKLIPFTGKIKRFTVHNFKGNDLIMSFPGGANPMDRRKEAKPQGVWFFVPVLTNNGTIPEKPGETGTLKYSFEVKPVNGTAAEKQVSAVSVPEQDGVNHLYNSGFEKETNAGHADGWGAFFHGWGMQGESSFFRDYTTLFHLEHSGAFEGSKCVRIVLPPNMGSLNYQHTEVRSLLPDSDAVFSIYMKSYKKGGAKVTLWVRYGDQQPKTFTVDDTWKRYEFPFKTPKSDRVMPWIGLKGGIVWIDAAKLEHGKKATPYSGENTTAKNEKKTDGPNLHINIPLLDKAPELNGKLTDPAWEKCAVIKDFWRVKNEGKVTKDQTIAKLGVYGTTLYAAFECFGKNTPPVIKKHDDVVWHDDCVELFIDPGNPILYDDLKAKGSYYHIAVNANNAWYDTYTGADIRFFDGKIRPVCSRSDDKWIAEIAIDLASLNINPIKRNWRILLGREDHTNGQYCANAPLNGTFHSYDEFPYAEVDQRVIDKLNAFQLAEPKIGDGKITIQASLSKPAVTDFELTVVQNDKQLLNRKWNCRVSDKLSQVADFPLNPEDTGVVYVSITAKGPNGESANRNWGIDQNSGLFFRRNFYTSEKQAELIWFGSDRPKANGEADFNGKKIPFEVKDDMLVFEIADAPLGSYNVIVNGKKVPFEKYQSKKNEVKIDRLNGLLIVDGKPFFFNGPFVEFSYLNSFVHETWTLPELKRLGYNGVCLFIREGYNSPNDGHAKTYCWDISYFKRFMDACERHGLKVIVMNAVYGVKYQVFAPRTMIGMLKDHPAYLAYYISDEPTHALYEKTWDSYRFLRSVDPQHPILVNVTEHGMAQKVVTDPKTNKDPFDIFSLTFYPVGRFANPDAKLRGTTRTFERMWAQVKKQRGVLYHAAQAYGYGNDQWHREPTPAELHFLIYMPLIQGNTGWNWFGGFMKCRESQEAADSFVPELKTLAEILGNGRKVNDGRVFTSLCGNVIATMWKSGGKHYLITVNQSDLPLKAKFDLTGYSNLENARVMFENRKHDLSKEDAYKPYERHVYEF